MILVLGVDEGETVGFQFESWRVAVRPTPGHHFAVVCGKVNGWVPAVLLLTVDPRTRAVEKNRFSILPARLFGCA